MARGRLQVQSNGEGLLISEAPWGSGPLKRPDTELQHRICVLQSQINSFEAERVELERTIRYQNERIRYLESLLSYYEPVDVEIPDSDRSVILEKLSAWR